MVLAKNLHVFNGEYDFTDIIITNGEWDSNLLDLLVKVDYYWSEEEIELIIRFKGCRESIINMPKSYDYVSEQERNSYVSSWYTITSCDIAENKGVFRIKIKTIDDDPVWLSVVCDEVILERKCLNTNC